MTEVSLFESDLLSPEVQSLLPPGYTLRALRSNDYERGFLKVLEVLTEVGNHTKQEFDDHTITITEDAKDQVVAVGTILVERKFVHKNGLVGHIEDIAVNNNQQGKKLGLRIIQALKFIGAKRGCYKVILDCSEKNVPFYQKCGFTQKEVEMAWYVPEVKARL
ncbi:hypothetical protein MFLAVUS_002099 [Mucor flavus]|uniref:Glucosamine 6-phosphate N-acetyltransferase n=1 Tax=Mucor flavus TaxID=439312 RepID=A0ABP9YPC9_9FUNG